MMTLGMHGPKTPVDDPDMCLHPPNHTSYLYIRRCRNLLLGLRVLYVIIHMKSLLLLLLLLW